MADSVIGTPPRPTVPELGPSLGRLTARHAGAPPESGLDALRLSLVTDLFELADSARDFAESDDRGAAVACLSGKAWLARWERAVETAAGQLADLVDASFDRAAIESRYPAAQRPALHLDAVERRAIAGRLGAGAASFVAALEALDRAAAAASAEGARGRTGFAEWNEALLAAARRFEGAWLALEGAAADELAAWRPEVEEVRAWQRPRLPLYVATAGVLLVALYAGLLLGGFLPVPAPLRPMVEAAWRFL